MKLRTLLTAVLALAVALPALAASIRFPDVPADHPNSEAIHWAREEGLFKGYPDGRFQPAKELSENELRIVVKRLFDRYDAWTRADTAEFLHAGDQALKAGTTTKITTSTTRSATTTTTFARTTTTAAEATQNHHDAYLRVAIYHDESDNFYIHWVRSGWESLGWKWRLHTNDPSCGFSNGSERLEKPNGNGLPKLLSGRWRPLRQE